MKDALVHSPPLAAFLGLALLAGVAGAADDGRAQVEQRIKLTARLIADAPTAQRIAASGNAQAMGYFDESRLHQALAEEALRRGDVDAARKAVDQALQQIGQARRLVPDLPARQAAARQRFDQMLAATERLVESWRARAVAGGASDGALLGAISRVGTARGLGQQGRYDEGIEILAGAEKLILDGMSRLLGSREVDYTARAASPTEEFQIELLRYQGLADLVPLALRELAPTPAAVALAGRYRESGDDLRAQAMLAFHNGDLRAAMDGLRLAMQAVQRALAAAGVATPPPTGS